MNHTKAGRETRIESAELREASGREEQRIRSKHGTEEGGEYPLGVWPYPSLEIHLLGERDEGGRLEEMGPESRWRRR